MNKKQIKIEVFLLIKLQCIIAMQKKKIIINKYILLDNKKKYKKSGTGSGGGGIEIENDINILILSDIDRAA